METLSGLFGMLSLVSIVIYSVIYLNFLKNPKNRPPDVNWIFWSCAALMNAWTYFFVVRGNLFESIGLIAEAIASIVIFIIIKIKNKNKKEEDYYLIILIISLFLIFFFFTFNSEDKNISNLYVQMLYIIGYILIIIKIKKKKTKEPLKSYAWGIISSCFLTLSLVSNFEGDYIAFIDPAMTTVGNSLVMYFSVNKD